MTRAISSNVAAIVACVLMLFGGSAQRALGATIGGYNDVYYVSECGDFNNTAPAFTGSIVGLGFLTGNSCASGIGPGASLQIAAAQPPVGSAGKWFAETPAPYVRIVGAYAPPDPPAGNPTADCTLASDGYYAEFVWGDQGVNYGSKPITIDCFGRTYGMGPVYGINQNIQSSRYFGWQVSCNSNTAGGPGFPACKSGNSSGQLLYVSGMRLEVQDTVGPSFSIPGTTLWNHNGGWVRGSWNLVLGASDPTGVCNLTLSVDGAQLASYNDPSPDTSNWAQCPGSQLNQSISTASYPDGAKALSVGLSATNAAGAASTASEAFSVDNAPVTVSMSGTGDVPTMTGGANVSVHASAGPSGVAGIFCSVDGARKVLYRSADAQIPVSGFGGHSVSCYAQNNAVDSGGTPATSSTQNAGVQLRLPTVSAVSFKSLVDALRCRHIRERQLLPAQWVVERYRGHRVRVKVPARVRVVKVVRCRARVVTKRVMVGGHLRTVRVAVVPHVVDETRKRVSFGRTTTVSGWLATARGDALGGQPVQIETAPDNGRGVFTTVATATTAANGTWRAKVPAGPSRLVVAVYGGAASIEPASSTPVKIIVPASVRITVTPNHTHWGGQIRITGRLRGGFVPAGGELVVLRIGWPGGSAEIGHFYTTRSGRFATPYTFLRGSGYQSYQLWAVTAREGDYPFAPARSAGSPISVGP